MANLPIVGSGCCLFAEAANAMAHVPNVTRHETNVSFMVIGILYVVSGHKSIGKCIQKTVVRLPIVYGANRGRMSHSKISG